MRIVLHAGFPKTGSTSLQTWMAGHAETLLEANIIYPKEGRDNEGLGHHLLNSDALISAERLAESIAEIAHIHRDSSKVLFFSCEGISNCLGKPENHGSQFFSTLHNRLSTKGFDLTVLLTLRRLDSYVKSILIQNIVYDRLNMAPSSFAEHTVYALANAYQSLTALSKTGIIRLFQHSSNINNQIADYLFYLGGSDNRPQVAFGRQHTSTGEERILFYIWLNSRQAAIAPDFNSFLLFENESTALLSSYYDQFIRPLILHGDYQGWRPPIGLLDAIQHHGRCAWEIYSGDVLESTESGAILKDFLGHSLVFTELDFLPVFDIYFRHALEKSSQAQLESLLRLLITKGSELYGQDFSLSTSLAGLS